MKKKLAAILAAVMLLSMLPLSAFGASPVSVTYNGSAVSFPDAKPFIDGNSRTLTPLAPIAAAMGLTYTWDGAKNIATFVREYTGDDTPFLDKANETHPQNYYVGKETVAFTIGSRNAVYTAYFYEMSDTERKSPIADRTFTKTVEMDTAAVLSSSRTYAPVKYMAENLGFKVQWLDATQTVSLSPDKSGNGLMTVELIGGDGKSLSFGAFKGRLYDVAGITNTDLKTVKIGTDNLHYTDFTAKELAAMKSLNSAPYLAGARIEENFPSAKKQKITLYFTFMYDTGLFSPFEYEFEYTYSGGPVYY